MLAAKVGALATTASMMLASCAIAVGERGNAPECNLNFDLVGGERQTIVAMYTPDFEYPSLYVPACDRYLMPLAPIPTTASYDAFRALRRPDLADGATQEFEIETSGYVVAGGEHEAPGFVLELVRVLRVLTVQH